MQVNEAMGIVRNPVGIGTVRMREARLLVCEELERLQSVAKGRQEEAVRFTRQVEELTAELKHYRDLIEQPLNVQELHYKDGAFDIKATHPLAASLFNEVCGLFISGGGENYFQMDGYHPKTGPIQIIVQRAEGKNPAQVAVEQKAVADRYRGILQSVHDDLFDYGTGKLTAETMQLVEDEMGAK